MLRVGPSPVISRLVRAEFLDLVVRDESCLLTLRWQATGPAGSLFPVLDADIPVTPHAEDAVIVRLDGSYRAPLGAVGRESTGPFCTAPQCPPSAHSSLASATGSPARKPLTSERRNIPRPDGSPTPACPDQLSVPPAQAQRLRLTAVSFDSARPGP
jgi:hypothetical protein